MYGYIYKIENLINKKVYVGQTTQNPEKRETQHFAKLKSGKHFNIHLQRSFNKYGESNFNFSVLLWANSKNELDQLEKYFINKHNSLDYIRGYNKREGGSNGPLSEETKQKIRKTLTGKYVGEKHPMHGKCGELAPFYGKKHSEESIKKMSEVKKGKIFSEEHIANLSKAQEKRYLIFTAPMKGQKHSPESIEKMKKSHQNVTLRTRKKGSITSNKNRLFPGVHYIKNKKPLEKGWTTRISFNNHSTFLGCYLDPISASFVYCFVRDEIFKGELLNVKED